MGDGYCDDVNNHPGCEYDGGDCCGDVNKEYCTLCECLEEHGMNSCLFVSLDAFIEGKWVSHFSGI